MVTPEAARSRARLYWELAGLLSIGGLTVYYLSISWRKWPDPTIDFGRELYVPWRLSQGALLYRDVDDLYGPLSQYLNSILFKSFGPGLMTLVTANLVIFTAIMGTLYGLFRRAWGVLAAQVALAIFVSVFAFGQYVGVGNTNYATPYAHETTHGILVCVLLTTVLLRWIPAPTLRNSVLAGFLLGLTAVLKPEIMLAGTAVTVVAIATRWRTGQRTSPAVWMGAAMGALLPTLGFAAFFATRLPWGQALTSACRAWLSVTTSARYVAEPVQIVFLGLDRPWAHFLNHSFAVGCALAFFGLIAAGAWAVDKSRSIVAQSLIAVAVFGLSFWVVWTQVDWAGIGRCFLGLVLLYLLVQAVRYFRRGATTEPSKADTARLLIASLAAVLMARMVLNGRVNHYGYYQAALAGISLPAIMLREVPDWLRMRAPGRWLMALCTLMAVTVGVIILSHFSAGIFKVKTFGVGTGIDKFYTMAPEEDPMGLVVNSMVEALQKTPAGQSMLVLPEGVMLNYLTRKPSPISPFLFFSAITGGGLEHGLVLQLDRQPPDWVMLISRDLSEYGIKRYGEDPDSGQEMLAWVGRNYELTASIGADPFANGQRAAQLYVRRHPAPASPAAPH